SHAIDDLVDDLLELGLFHRATRPSGRAAQVDRRQLAMRGEEIDGGAELGARALIERCRISADAPLAVAEIREPRVDRRERVSFVPQARDGDSGRHGLYNARLRARSSVG